MEKQVTIFDNRVYVVSVKWFETIGDNTSSDQYVACVVADMGQLQDALDNLTKELIIDVVDDYNNEIEDEDKFITIDDVKAKKYPDGTIIVSYKDGENLFHFKNVISYSKTQFISE